MLEGQNKAEEIRRAREMEIEMMKAARQAALEEEDRQEQMARVEIKRNVSPGLEAAKNVHFNRNLINESDSNIEQIRLERLREIEEMKRAREELVDDDMDRHEKSEAARELEVFRTIQSSGTIKDRYRPAEKIEKDQPRSQVFAKAPKSRAKSDNWMVNSNRDKMEEARLARERAMLENERRLEASRKAHEMSALVADLQRMRNTTARDAEEEAQMTRYQEEMLSRVMELHEIARGGIVGN